MLIILLITVAILFILMEILWKNLDTIEKKDKIIFIVLSIAITFILTLIIFNISKTNIIYSSEKMMSDVRNAIVPMFTALNGIIFIPIFAKIYAKIQNKEINTQKLKIYIIILATVIVLGFITEVKYFGNIQQGILQIYNSKITKQEG